jgi:hypothetical protein
MIRGLGTGGWGLGVGDGLGTGVPGFRGSSFRGSGVRGPLSVVRCPESEWVPGFSGFGGWGRVGERRMGGCLPSYLLTPHPLRLPTPTNS